jgi:hypothetical protein
MVLPRNRIDQRQHAGLCSRRHTIAQTKLGSIAACGVEMPRRFSGSAAERVDRCMSWCDGAHGFRASDGDVSSIDQNSSAKPFSAAARRLGANKSARAVLTFG